MSKDLDPNQARLDQDQDQHFRSLQRLSPSRKELMLRCMIQFIHYIEDLTLSAHVLLNLSNKLEEKS